MGPARKEIKQKAIEIYTKISPDFGGRVAKGLGMEAAHARL